MENPNIAVVFDEELRYVVANDQACSYLNKQKSEIEGRCILDVFPEIIASQNHRNLLKALEGDSVNDIIEGRNGDYFFSSYRPIFFEKEIIGLVTEAKILKTKM